MTSAALHWKPNGKAYRLNWKSRKILSGLRTRHQRLEDQIQLQESLSQSATQRLSAHAMLYNMLSLAMERAIQLYGAVT